MITFTVCTHTLASKHHKTEWPSHLKHTNYVFYGLSVYEEGEVESGIFGTFIPGRFWVQPDRAELHSDEEFLKGEHLTEHVNLFISSLLPSDKQQGLWDSDYATGSDQRFGAGAAAGPGEPARREASRQAQHQASHPLPQDRPHQLPH